MATPLVRIGPLLQNTLGYLASRQAWRIAGGSWDDLPHHLKAMRDELNEPRLDWLAYGGWRASLRPANHLAGVRRQPTLLLCRYTVAAAAMGLLAHATAIPHFRLILGLITNRELAEARLAAGAVSGLPLQLAMAAVSTPWRATGYSLFSAVVLDYPLAHQLERELARNPVITGVTLYSPLSISRL